MNKRKAPRVRMLGASYIGEGSEEGWPHDEFRVILEIGDRTLETPWRQGLGLRGVHPVTGVPRGEPLPPSARDVFACILSDAAGAEADTFDGWCGNMGYNTDSRTAERLYRKLRRHAHLLQKATGMTVAEAVDAWGAGDPEAAAASLCASEPGTGAVQP